MLKSAAVYLLISLVCVAVPFLVVLLYACLKSDPTTQLLPAENLPVVKEEIKKKTTPPEYVRGIYLTAYSANRDEWRARLIKKMTTGRINTVVIDIKDYSGYVLYPSELEMVKELETMKPQMPDPEKILKEFHQANIYVIARQTVFQDPALIRARPDLAIKTHNNNPWYDNMGLGWTDPQNQEVWDYNLAISKEVVELGFDEVNFDYIRFPSDGNLGAINFNLPLEKSKADVLEEYFTYLSNALSGSVNISIDMFGLVLDNAQRDYDLGIGQRLVRALDYFDFICPMVYPSHYPLSYLNLGNPAAYPRAIITYDLKVSQRFFIDTRASLRPWLQAFNLGAVYDSYKIEAQIEATQSATSTTGWVLWNARNYYPDYIF